VTSKEKPDVQRPLTTANAKKAAKIVARKHGPWKKSRQTTELTFSVQKRHPLEPLELGEEGAPTSLSERSRRKKNHSLKVIAERERTDDAFRERFKGAKHGNLFTTSGHFEQKKGSVRIASRRGGRAKRTFITITASQTEKRGERAHLHKGKSGENGRPSLHAGII